MCNTATCDSSAHPGNMPDSCGECDHSYQFVERQDPGEPDIMVKDCLLPACPWGVKP